MTPLSPKRRSELRAEAHKLNPIVIIGDKGLTDEVLSEIDRSLKAHELIKVRAATDERDARDVWLETICERLEAHPVQQIGKIFVLYRESAEEKHSEVREKTPARSPGGRRKNVGASTGPRGGVVTERGKLRQRSRDLDKKRELDVKDMVRKGKIKPITGAATRLRAEDTPPEESTRTARPRSRTPSPRPASGPPRRRPRTSR